MIEKYVSPAEFKRLISALLVVVGFISLAALFAFIVVPGLRYQAHTTQASPVQAVRSESGWLDPTDYPPAPKQILPPLDPKTVMTPNPLLMAQGKTVFEQTCASCHGPEGKGDGPSGKTLNPKPRDFTSKDGWKNGTRLEDIYKTLEEGIKGSPMVSYSYLRRKDRMALVHVVQSFGAFDHGQSDSAAHEALEKSFASAGEVIPNRIPVKAAVAHLISEDQPVPALAKYMENPLLKEAVVDPAKATRTLAGIPGWASSDEILARALVIDVPGNGFAPGIATYSPERWKALRLALGGLR